MPEITNFDIDKYYRGNKLYGGCWSNDNLPRKLKKKFYIINLENSDQPGSHWVFLDNTGAAGKYYDPFGEVPTTEVSRYVQKYSNEDYQNLVTDSCGWFCLYFGDNVTRGLPADYGLTEDPQKNEQIIKKYFNTLS